LWATLEVFAPPVFLNSITIPLQIVLYAILVLTDLKTKDSPVIGYRVFEVFKVSVYTPLAPEDGATKRDRIFSRRTSTKDLESPQ